MKGLKIILIVSLLSATSSYTAGKVTDPGVFIDHYAALAVPGNEVKTYDYLMKVFQEYYPVISNPGSEYSDIQFATAGLKWVFPHLMEGAFYYSEHNDQQRAVQFAEAYVDTYIHPSMKSAGLEVNQLYPTLSYFAASHNYNQRKYDKAIIYLDAYIRSGDTKNLADAFNYLAKAYIKTGHNDEAVQVLAAGLNLFPADLKLLTTAINHLAETKSDDVALQKYVSQALRYKPDEVGLLNIQAQLYERQSNFDKAAEFYKKLQILKPKNLEVARHLGINLYNSAIQTINTSGMNSTARQKLNTASGILSDVVISDPLAMNYIYALANTYSLLGDKTNLDIVNAKIAALGRKPVSEKGVPQLLAVDNNHVSPTSIPDIPSPSQSANADRQNISAYNGYATAAAQVPPVVSAPAAPAQKSPVSDVDKDIPMTNYTNNDAFAVIIANNEYKKVADVDNADNDGRIFAEYCNKVLGIPQSHIRTHFNVTYGELLDAVEDIKSIAAAKKGDLNVLFYYAGHGVPDEKTKSAYILPVDADGKQIRLCYPLSELYAELSGMKANNTLVFLDACFSGATRSASNEMLLSARSVAIDVDPCEVDGKLLIFSAATGDQTALSYDGQNHGMFTYFLLKRLKESKGTVTLGSLADYITENVALESQLVNKKQQMPTVIVGNEYDPDGWKNLKLVR